MNEQSAQYSLEYNLIRLTEVREELECIVNESKKHSIKSVHDLSNTANGCFLSIQRELDKVTVPINKLLIRKKSHTLINECHKFLESFPEILEFLNQDMRDFEKKSSEKGDYARLR